MRTFSCPRCGDEMFFGNLRCAGCATDLCYSPPADQFVAGAVACENRETVEACNWERFDERHCLSCHLDVGHEATLLRAPFQEAKRRTLRQLLQAGVVILDRAPALRFDLREGGPGDPVTIGHADGVITIDTAEADPAHRERTRTALEEPYRTPLGHIRHEIGHWYWAAVAGSDFSLDAFRAMFGDERASYADALRQHYEAADDGSWSGAHISHYAAAHPWEDFAESFAHYLHMGGTIETAAWHLTAAPPDPHEPFAGVYERWVNLTSMLNELNRSMGIADPYPFAPSATAVAKIEFINDALAGALRG